MVIDDKTQDMISSRFVACHCQDRQFCREVHFQQTSGIADEAASGYQTDTEDRRENSYRAAKLLQSCCLERAARGRPIDFLLPSRDCYPNRPIGQPDREQR